MGSRLTSKNLWLNIKSILPPSKYPSILWSKTKIKRHANFVNNLIHKRNND